MSKKRRAWVKFEKQNEREGFAIYITTHNGDWGLDSWFPCVAKVGADKVGAEDETDYVHWTILRKLSHLQNLGYDLEIDY